MRQKGELRFGVRGNREKARGKGKRGIGREIEGERGWVRKDNRTRRESKIYT